MFCLDHFSLHRIIKMLNFKVNDPLNDEPLNTFGTLELLFPISKNEFVVVLSQFIKTIILNFFLRSKIHHSFLLIFKMYHCFVPK